MTITGAPKSVFDCPPSLPLSGSDTLRLPLSARRAPASPTRAFETTLEALATTTTVGGVEYVASSAPLAAGKPVGALALSAAAAVVAAAGLGLGF
jgi:hypothetical protein